MISKLCQLGAASNVFNCEKATDEQSLEQMFASHISEFGLSYATKEEYNFRLSIYSETDKRLGDINARLDITYFVDHNMFSTLTQHERRQYLGKLNRPANDDKAVELPTENLEASVDWRTKGGVNPVTN